MSQKKGRDGSHFLCLYLSLQPTVSLYCGTGPPLIRRSASSLPVCACLLRVSAKYKRQVSAKHSRALFSLLRRINDITGVSWKVLDVTCQVDECVPVTSLFDICILRDSMNSNRTSHGLALLLEPSSSQT